ncbi:DNA/RNA helicase domain-containing protein [Piscibacillus salipiscarius]|uniref:DNA/RNA helicase domain-containing protein n=1 Tax=Piscibacillus salipiscarius TaxID=299480 RepID=A0ABW5QE53_9BACI
MIVYEASKEEFLTHVDKDELVSHILDQFELKLGRTSESEIRSWDNSMLHMYRVLNDQSIPNDAGVAIEFKIPYTSKRVDFLLSGHDGDNDSVVIVELKQWSEVEKVEGKEAIVKTAINRGFREVTHPSYQAWSYAVLIEDYNENVQDQYIQLKPCSYLHNYRKQQDDPLTDDYYEYYLNLAPVYAKGDVEKLRNFIKKYIKHGDNKEILYQIEQGKIRPSKSLQDSLASMLKGNQEFVMIDEQKVFYETALELAERAVKTDTKQVMIVEGGPGTGKSVLAINLLVALTNQSLTCQYVTKNSAPRSVYSTKLKGDFKKTRIDNLFKGSGSYTDTEENELDILVVDEAHRLNEKSGMFQNMGENQVKEVIHTAKLSVFFIDENQRVTLKDVGNVDMIKKFANEYGAEITYGELASQFRCDGSDGYIAWLEDVLQIRETANANDMGLDYNFKVFSDPHEMKREILEKNKINNKSRIVSGYCWEWPKDNRSKSEYHDIRIEEYDFGMSWNLDNTSTWAIDEESIHEAGCIHTCQGLEFDYVGVIIGDDLRFENGEVITDHTKRAKSDQSLRGIKKMLKEEPEKAEKVADQIIRNTYRTLMTRGQKGCYVYCTDKLLEGYLKTRLNRVKYYKEVNHGDELVAEEKGNYDS